MIHIHLQCISIYIYIHTLYTRFILNPQESGDSPILRPPDFLKHSVSWLFAEFSLAKGSEK